MLNASLLALSGLLILGGKLGDVLGRRRMFLFGTVLFIAGSALGGFAPAFVLLLVGAVAAAGFVWWEHRTSEPLMKLRLLRRTPNYLGSTLSQALAGLAEMGVDEHR